MSVLDLEVTDALLTTTRSVRKRLDLERPVPKDVIERCIEISTQAPTGSNAQSWRWLVVTESGKRAALAEIYNKGARAYLGDPDKGSGGARKTQTGRVLDSARYLMTVLHRVPVHVIPCIEVEEPPETTSLPYWASVMGSIMPAVWSFNLALRARGLGTVLTTLHLQNADEVESLLGIPRTVLQVGLLPVAYTVGTRFKTVERLPVDAITHWEQW